MDWMRSLVALAAMVSGCSFDSAAASGGGNVGGDTTGQGTTDGPATTSVSASGGAATTQGSASAGGSETSGGDSEGSAGSSASTSTSTSGETTSSSTGSNDDTGGSTGTSEACRDACDPNASCDERSGEPVCSCDEGFFGDGASCTALDLSMLRVELPCVDAAQCGTIGCAMQETDEETAMLVGDPAVTYAVTLRFRGVIEQKTYTGGSAQDGFFHPDATPDGGGYNLFALEVDTPARTYYLNSGSSGINHCFALDEEHVVEVQGESELRLFSHNGFDICGVRNIDDEDTPIVIEDVPPDPDPFDGQFIQVDVIDISPV